MPSIQNPARFLAAYVAMKALLEARRAPTRQLYGNQFVFRAIDAAYLPPPPPGGFATPQQQSNALSPFDEGADRNRWSGSGVGGVAGRGGLYCVLQQQALVNEAMHYHRGQKGPAGPFDPAALAAKAIVKIRLNRTRLCVDLSTSNPGAKDFLALLLDMVERGSTQPMKAGFPHINSVAIQKALGAADASVPRGVGLAVAGCGYAPNLIVPTMRFSERSIYERGDNLVFFGPQQAPIPGLSVEAITYA